MKNWKFSLRGFVGAIVVSLIVGMLVMAVAEYTGCSLYKADMIGMAAAVANMAICLVPGKRAKGLAYVGGVQVEVWQNHIEGNLFKNNDFLLQSADASQYVTMGKVVHIPQAGAKPATAKNRAVTGDPTAVTQRTDTDVTYNLDVFTTDPTLIQKAEEIESSYNKRESVLSEHQLTLRELIADSMLVNWAPSAAARILRTSGGDIDAHLPDATGTRKKFTVADLKSAQKAMNKQKMPLDGRMALMSADMYNQMTDELTATQFRDFSSYVDAARGVVGKLWGFEIYLRADVVTYDNSVTPVVKAYNAATAADDNDAVLCWHKDYVERAIGGVDFYYTVDSPVYFGDVFSIGIRMGGRKRRAGEEGLIAIVQQP